MRRSPWIAAMLACLCGAAQADGVDLSGKPKAIAAAMATRSAAPFAAGHEAWPFPVDPVAVESPGLQSACDRSAHDLCYDLAEGRIVYRAARNYMPKVGELRPESVTLRRNRIVFKYSFR